MRCFLCKGTAHDALTTFMVDLGNGIVIVKNVPSKVCGQCGEVSYDTDVTKELERIVDSMRTLVAEIAVINYPDKVA